MKVPSFIKSIANISYEKLAPNLGDMLLVTGTLGWILSSIAHVTAIVINNKIPDDQKKFLIPQELADAGVNIASFILLTRSCQKLGERLVETGKFATPRIREFLAKLSKAEISKKDFNLTNSSAFKNDKAFQDEYYKFSDGVSFIASTIGSIISCNIVTPILRNKFASAKQKQALAQDKMQNAALAPYSPVLPAQNRFNIDDYKSKVMNVSSGSMKI